MTAMRLVVAGLCVIVITACNQGDSAVRTSLSTPPSANAAPPASPVTPVRELRVRSPAQIQLDSGNIAFRGKKYALATAHYRAATRLDPQSAAAWFGVSMAATAAGDSITAASARARMHKLAAMMSPEHPVR